MMGSKEEGGQGLKPEEVVFKSRTHVIVMDDYQGKPGLLFPQHIKSTKDDFDKLEGLEGKLNKDRKGRNNVTFAPLVKIDGTLQYFKSSMDNENRYVYSFPKVADEVG